MEYNKMIINVGSKKMIIRKDSKGNLISVNDQDGNDVESGSISMLRLGNEAGKKFRTDITDIPNDTVIETHSSPGCKWYFFNGQWYRICT